MAHLFVSLLVSLVVASAAPAVTMAWTPIGNPGNVCDPQSQGCFGAVGYSYSIGTYEVTNAQYAEFLNAVADTDTNVLYNTSMGSGFGGIARVGAPGSFTYTVIAGSGDRPVNFVSFSDALRFANWLHNGQPSGAQGSSTTEDGAYTFSPTVGPRNAGATIFLPSEDEWYKAAYYDAPGASYFDYPAGSNTQTTCATPTVTVNQANCNNAVGDLTNVGSYTGSPGPYGTFDQGGNVLEWTEAIISVSNRGLRGGGYSSSAIALAASIRGSGSPSTETEGVGFRVAPEPDNEVLLIAGVLGLLGLAGWRRVSA